MTLPGSVKEEVGAQKKADEESKDRQVWVGGIRYDNDYTIGAEPYKKAGKEYQLWTFFQKLAGGDTARRIESITTFPPETGEA